ncbi:alpha/beta family hydrolase [Vibrio stylophorae]|nr:alpha/beta family hydrolase [Vibrio stylophorae]
MSECIDLQAELRIDEAQGKANGLFIFAHGAGAGMDHEFMQSVAQGLAELGVTVVRFNFPYMAEQQILGKKRPPNRAPVLLAHFAKVVAYCANRWSLPLYIGGKSMGGRMASLLMSDAENALSAELKAKIQGVVCLGFPFHPVGKPDRFKGEHLALAKCSTLILQGERDSFGNRSDCADYPLSPAVQLHWIGDGDHSFKPRKSSGRSHAQNIDEAVQVGAGFITKSYP